MKRGTKRTVLVLLCLILAGGGYSYWAVNKPLPKLKAALDSNSISSAKTVSKLDWPQFQAAVAVEGTNILETVGTQTPLPTASTAKMITALTVLKAKPLSPGEQGPSLTMTAEDVARYQSYVAADGSVVPVQAGEKLTEYQVLQAVMLPSANNLADSLAIWAYGSLDNYTKAANAYVAGLGLEDTHIGSDASGLSPDTVSTAHDLAIIGEAVMKNPVLAGIAAQTQATGIPYTSVIKNVNFLLGTSGIVGIKTGNSDQAGGVYVSASVTTVSGKPVTLITAVMGAPNLYQSMSASLPLIKSAQANFETVKLAGAGQVVGRYKAPWGPSSPAVVDKSVQAAAWGGTAASASVKLKNLPADSAAGATAGEVVLPASAYNQRVSAPVKLQKAIQPPNVWWRLTHPFK
jgi:D-alanyl-D-alanine carboxypeptidase (penicillin-binding protein 5/6)